MEDRRKIVVHLNSEPETPHFDAEETLLSARPVVPIAPAAAVEGFNSTRGNAPFYKRSAFLALVVITAVGIGLAAGLSIARYRYQPEDASTTAAQPAQAPPVSDTRTATVQTPKNQQAPTLPELKVEEKTTVNDTGTEDNEKADAPAPTKVSIKAPEGSKEKSSGETDDNVRTTKPEPRDKKRTSDDDSDTYTPRAQRRERRGRNRDENTVNIPRRIERAGEQINRIREIFEGSQQRP